MKDEVGHTLLPCIRYTEVQNNYLEFTAPQCHIATL